MKEKQNKNLWVRIGIICGIILVIVAIYIVKNITESGTVDNKNGVSQSDKVKNYPLEITNADIEKVKSYGLPTLLDFGSDSCIPCKHMKPTLVDLNEKLQGKAVVQFIDVWKNTDGVQDYPIQLIPTQVFFNSDGTAYEPSETIKSTIEFNFHSDPNTGKHTLTLHQGALTEEQILQIFAEMGVK